MSIYKNILAKTAQGKKLFAILIDPDKQRNSDLLSTIQIANSANVDCFFVGGSLLLNDNLGECIKTCLLYTSPSPRDLSTSRMPSSA